MKALIKSLPALVALLVCGVSSARAQQVQAALAQDHVAVGQPVQLNLSVTGGSGVRLPDRISVEGLDIRFAGKSEQTQVTMTNGRLNAVTSAIYTYMIIPVKAGTYTIPSLSVQVGGKVLKTDPLTLTVGGVPGAPSSGNVPVLPAIPVPNTGARTGVPSSTPPQVSSPHRAQVPPPSEPAEPVFGEIVIPRKTAYVGEVIPVELRFYFAVPARTLQEKPSFSGDGFTVMNFAEPTQSQQEINGRMYQFVAFKTAITPVKSGPIEIGPAKLPAAIQLPSSRPSDDFFGNLFGALDYREHVVETRPVTLEVKPLPKDGRPAEFAGAIGQFSIEATANPKKAGPNDPVSLNVKVSGRGNFDAMSPPVLQETEGWRTYPPGESFTPSPSDPIGFNGEKTFEYMLLAREDRSVTPIAEFSYFDPAIERYVTLKTAPIAVEARGGSAVPAPTPAVAVAASPSPGAASPQPAAETDVLVRNYAPATFRPFVENTAFLVANGALAVTWAALLFLGIGRVVFNSKSARAAAARYGESVGTVAGHPTAPK